MDRVFRLIQQQGPSRRASSTKGSAPATSNVLCIDDMEGIRKMAERTLSNAGFGVVVAASAEQGLTVRRGVLSLAPISFSCNPSTRTHPPSHPRS